MNDNSFLKMLGLEYLDLSKAIPYFGEMEKGCPYYYKGKLNRFERQLLKADSLLFNRNQDLAAELRRKDSEPEYEEKSVVFDYDEEDAVNYMMNRVKGNIVPIAEEGEVVDLCQTICEEFLELSIRQRLNIPFAHGYVITKGYKVYYYFPSDHPSFVEREEEGEY